MPEILQQFFTGITNTTWYECIAVIFGIISVWYSKKENILVYPVGLINTMLYVYLNVKWQLFGEAVVNLYYSGVSIYGWVLWSRRDLQHQKILRITFSNTTEWKRQLLFFLSFYLVIYLCLSYMKREFAPGALPAADSFASATAFTGMWLMARKKVESWYWWMATNIASVPLYFVKGYVFTSFYYLVLLLLAISGWMEWKKKAREV